MAKAVERKDEAPAQTTALAKKNPVTDIVVKKEKAIINMLPSHVDPKRFMRTLVEVASSPKLLECSPISIEKSIMDLAFLGLTVGPLGYAYLIPFGGVCQLQIGYKGLVALARRSGEVASVQGDVVREGDDFDYSKGTDSFLRHRPAFANGRQSKKITHAWAMFTLKDGSSQWDVMSIEEIHAIRNRSEGYQAAIKYKKDSPWTTDESEMCKKTVVKRVCKLLNLSPELAKALEVDNEADNVVAPQKTEAPPIVVAEPALRKSKPQVQEAVHEDVKPSAAEPTVNEVTGVIDEDPEGAGYGPEDDGEQY